MGSSRHADRQRVSEEREADRRRVNEERERDRRARREAAQRNAAKGVGPNLEEAIRLLRTADAFRAGFARRR